MLGIALAGLGPLLAAFIHVSSELASILNSTRLLPGRSASLPGRADDVPGAAFASTAPSREEVGRIARTDA